MIIQAYKGVRTEYPANTMTAFRAVGEQRYDSVYLEVSRTKDGQWVVCNEAQRLDISGWTEVQRLEFDVGADFHMKFAGTPLALLPEVLELASDMGFGVRLGRGWNRLKAGDAGELFSMLKDFESVVMVTCDTVEDLVKVAAVFPQMQLQYDGPVDSSVLDEISQAVPGRELVIWLPYEKRDLSAAVRQVAKLGLEGICRYSQMEEAEGLGASAILTPGQIKPVQNVGVLSDMHTHSRNSMDANVPVLDLCQGEIEGGARIVAITEHEEMQWLETRKDYDMDAFLLGADREIKEVRKELGDQIEILQGIELGQAAWHPEEADRLIHLLPFDIIVGCVHEIRDPAIEDKIAAITPWQSFFKPEFAEKRHMFWEQYFAETLAMVQMVDIDVVAHLAFVARAAKLRLDLNVDLYPYEEMIRSIFQVMIEKGIALEINCGGFAKSGMLSTPDWIVKLYREMGGYLITLASDAHGASDPCKACFRQVADRLKEMGFRNIFYYKNRRSYPCTL